ncbi:MAG: 50S ribosomal protein L9 [Candidatus Omnitrophica bacterium]|nr:50S ribosomal protein L9 [Candidatus Omnitrophota bacterium]
MEVILNQDVDKIGKAGSVVKVKDGFARNFLIPNRLAVLVTTGNLKKLEQDKERKSLMLEALKNDAEALKAKLSSISLTLSSLAKEDEKLYGSITAHDIAVALKEEGIELDKSLIDLSEPIRALGIYEVALNLHPEVSAKLKVWVVKK